MSGPTPTVSRRNHRKALSVDGPLHYEAYGLRIRSEVPLPLRATVGPVTGVDVHLQIGESVQRSDRPLESDGDADVVAAFDDPGRGRWYVAFREGGRYRFRFRDTGEFLITEDLRTVQLIAFSDGHRAELLPIVFAGTVLAFILALRGDLALHASAVLDKGQVLAFIGHSGRGKSTLAALLASAGARIVTDDVLLVDTSGDEHVLCRGNAGEIRLRAGARDLAELFGPDTDFRSTADERLGLRTGNAEPRWARLGAIIVPTPSRDTTELSVVKAPMVRGLHALLAFPRVYGLRPSAIVRRQFELMGQVAARVPVYEVAVPWGPPFDPLIADGLLGVLER